MPDSPSLRVGDAERETALQALGEHMRVGRLDIHEYDERAARVAAARTRGELDEVFADLPEPHPVPLTLPAVQPASSSAAIARRDTRTGVQRAFAALVPLSWILALVLFFGANGIGWLIFLMPIAISCVAGALWGDDWKRGK
jgi:Domain of unknown function (DUF1707)